ncbi:hypothetical protein HanIR_Chr06g0268551 [Helianthus annuus]|nr:hypothetical protein HanIR_Chr06g0268551 [Helianthus annuus]
MIKVIRIIKQTNQNQRNIPLFRSIGINSLKKRMQQWFRLGFFYTKSRFRVSTSKIPIHNILV